MTPEPNMRTFPHDRKEIIKMSQALRDQSYQTLRVAHEILNRARRLVSHLKQVR